MTRNEIKYWEIGACYQLAEDYHVKTAIRPGKHIRLELITLTTSGDLFIKKYYTWDGCSGIAIDDNTNMRGGLIHDAGYQLLRSGELDLIWRKEFDNELEKACLEDGMHEFRADYYELAVNVLGENAADPKNKREVLTAP